MERRHREYDKRCGGNKDKKCDLKDKWTKTVDKEHKRVHHEKTRLDPSSEAEIERRSSERLCEKLKQKRYDDRCVHHPQDGNEEVEYFHAGSLTGTDWY